MVASPPRVVSAEVVGTHGATAVTGPELQSRFGLMSTYMRFTTVSARAIRRAPHVPHLVEGDRRVRDLALAARDYKLAVWDTSSCAPSSKA